MMTRVNLTPDNPVEEVIGTLESSLVPPLAQSRQRHTQSASSSELTKCHDSATVIAVSQMAAQINHTITTTRNFWNCTNSGT